MSAKLLTLYQGAVRATCGVQPPQATSNRARQIIKELLTEGYPYATVELAVRIAGRKLGSPLAIADAVPEAAQLLRDVGNLADPVEAIAEARDYVELNGWPTGVRFARVGASGTYVADPLGRDRAPYDVPGARRPKLGEIAAALNGAI